MATIDEIRQVIAEGNRKLREEVTADIATKVTDIVNTAVDTKIKEHEDKMIKQITAIQERTAKLEEQMANQQKQDLQGTASKRPRSTPVSVSRASHSSSGDPIAVLTGFPKNSRKKDIENFVKAELQTREEWKRLKGFAPNVRGTIAMIKMSTTGEVSKFIEEWSTVDHTYKGAAIRARFEKPPEKRKSNAKIYLMGEYLRAKFQDKEFDTDFKYACVWGGDAGVIVSWNVEEEEFEWNDDVIAHFGITINKTQAVEHTRRQ